MKCTNPEKDWSQKTEREHDLSKSEFNKGIIITEPADSYKRILRTTLRLINQQLWWDEQTPWKRQYIQADDTNKTENLKSPISIKEIQFIIKKTSQKSPTQGASVIHFIKHLRKK